MKRLLDVLREDCGLTGTKEGCGEGECGACTVLLDGQAVNACLVPFGQVRGRAVKTIEGLRGRHPLQQTFVTEGGAQCGFCTPGMIMAAAALPKNATLEDVRVGLAGNICRCTGYSGIYRAIEAAQQKAGGGKAARPARADRVEGRAGTAGLPRRSPKGEGLQAGGGKAGGGKAGGGKRHARRSSAGAGSGKTVRGRRA